MLSRGPSSTLPPCTVGRGDRQTRHRRNRGRSGSSAGDNPGTGRRALRPLQVAPHRRRSPPRPPVWGAGRRQLAGTEGHQRRSGAAGLCSCGEPHSGGFHPAFPVRLLAQNLARAASTSEGLVDAIRDKKDDDDDQGVIDKRLFCLEAELGAALRATQRQGNTLSAILRAAWDGHKIAPLTKNNKIAATDPHICILAHITRPELQPLLTASDVWNGFANHFVWLVVGEPSGCRCHSRCTMRT